MAIPDEISLLRLREQNEVLCTRIDEQARQIIELSQLAETYRAKLAEIDSSYETLRAKNYALSVQLDEFRTRK